MIYHFKDIESGQIAEGYTVLDINDHKAEILPLKAIKIINNKPVIYEVEDAPALLLAEKHGGELLTGQGKPPADPAKYKTEQVGKVEALRIAAEAAIQKQNQSTLTDYIEAGSITTADAPRLTDPVAEQQQETARRISYGPKKPDHQALPVPPGEEL